MAHALRHAPEQYGLTLDAQGWTAVSDLLIGLRQQRRWRTVTEADLEAVLALPGKRRYEMANGRIRALYGHSIPAKIEKAPATPPPVLYHGTPPGTADIILREGLKSMNRQYVHLSVDVETAVRVGKRRAARPVVLRINAKRAAAAGVRFYEGHEQVWLADAIPPTFIHPVEERES